MKSFFSNFDKKRFMLIARFIFIFLSIALIINIVGKTYTRYESNVDLSANAATAFFVVEQGTYESTIALNNLEPSNSPKYYTFYVANYNTDNKRTNVDLTYTIRFETTTNLPLTYEVIRNQSYTGNYTSLISSRTQIQDENDVYYNVFLTNQTFSFGHVANQVDEYTLRINFPLSYKDYPDLYQGAVELFSIIVDASQVA